jgi:peptidoglycan-associated lipoprotein
MRKVYPVLFIIPLLASCMGYHLQKGNECFDYSNYAKAIQHYKRYLRSSDDDAVRYKLAKAYRMINDQEKSLEQLSVLVGKEAQPDHVKVDYIKALMANYRHSDALRYLTDWFPVQAEGDLVRELWTVCDKVCASKGDSILYEITRLEIPGIGEAYAAVPFGDGVIVTAPSASSKFIDQWTGKPYYDLYHVMTGETSTWINENEMLPLNSSFHDGIGSFDPTTNTLYFTRSSFRKKKLVANSAGESMLEIWKSRREGKVWSAPVPLKLSEQECSYAHPCVSPDGSMLLFSSDMPGGFGGADIYVCDRNADGSWNAPVNAGPSVNTPGNELFPAMGPDGTLYFSSDRHGSMGGLDIFKSARSGQEWKPASGIGSPFNSASDDFGFIVETSGRAGYFSSSREGGDHIYRWKRPDPTFVYNASILSKTGEIIPHAEVTVVNKCDSMTSVFRSDESGRCRFSLRGDCEYEIIVSASSFYNNKDMVSTRGAQRSAVINRLFELEKIEIDKPIVLDNIFYDLDRWEIREDAKASLEKLVSLLKENPAIMIELSSHTDSRGNDMYNMILSQKRAQSAVSYIVSRGIDETRIVAKGYGETRLLNKCDNWKACEDEMHQVNRRTEFKVVKISQ